MQPFTTHTGRAVPLRRSNVDTDQIIPAHWLKRIERTGFGAGLFESWRTDPSFVLNDPGYDGASVLLAGPDFGTGSSREHAVWALQDYGFRAVIAPRFGDIFRNNAAKNGLLVVLLDEPAVDQLIGMVEADRSTAVTVDLEQCRVTAGTFSWGFEVDPAVRHKLLNGLDDIALTLQHADAIESFERHRAPWLPVTTGG